MPTGVFFKTTSNPICSDWTFVDVENWAFHFHFHFLFHYSGFICMYVHIYVYIYVCIASKRESMACLVWIKKANLKCPKVTRTRIGYGMNWNLEWTLIVISSIHSGFHDFNLHFLLSLSLLSNAFGWTLSWISANSKWVINRSQSPLLTSSIPHILLLVQESSGPSLSWVS
jgi:hypothetical protein